MPYRQRRLILAGEKMTKYHILNAFKNQTEELSRREIARRLERQKTPRLRDLLNELVQEGYLNYRLQRLANGVDMYLYTQTDKFINEIPF